MSDALAAAVARVWPDGASAWEALGGGITNHNVKVTRPDGVFVLRVAGSETDVLGIDRAVEHAATRAAAAAGVGPEVVAFVEPEGWLVTALHRGRDPAARSRCASPSSSTRVARGRARRARRPGDPGPLRRARGRRGVPRRRARARCDAARRVRRAHATARRIDARSRAA